MKKYIIILAILVTLVTTILLLAKIEDSQRTNNQNFWSIYFIDPFGDDDRFVIDNKTPTTQLYHYEVIKNEITTNSGDVEIDSGNRNLISSDSTKTPFEIIVTSNSESKTIYKK